jgi:hypothetical protein
MYYSKASHFVSIYPNTPTRLVVNAIATNEATTFLKATIKATKN